MKSYSSFKDKHDFFEFIWLFHILPCIVMNSYINSGLPRFQMDSPRDQPLTWQKILNLHNNWNACLFGFEYFQETTPDSWHHLRNQPPLASTRQYTFNLQGMNYQPTTPLCSLTLNTNPAGWNRALSSLGATVSWLGGALGTAAAAN